MQAGHPSVKINVLDHNQTRGRAMSTENTAQDPMEFMRNMWSKMGFRLPGMVTPSLDVV